MRRTRRLLQYLHRVFDKDPAPFAAFRLSYVAPPEAALDAGDALLLGTEDGDALTTEGGALLLLEAGEGSPDDRWTVADGFLTTTTVHGIGDLRVDLSAHTVESLVAFLSAQPGYTVTGIAAPSLSRLSARVLLDGDGPLAGDGSTLEGYTSLLWAMVESWSAELSAAAVQIVQALRQITLATADGEWLDEHGALYGVPRAGEVDDRYRGRIIAEVLMPRGNNVAIEAALRRATGQAATVTDAFLIDAGPFHDGSILHDGSEDYLPDGTIQYNLFDVTVGFDLLGPEDPAEFYAFIVRLLERLRAAGTHLRTLELAGSTLEDDAAGPLSDGLVAAVRPAFTDAAAAALSDTISLTASAQAVFTETGLSATDPEAAISVVASHRYDALRRYDGAIRHCGGVNELQSLEGTIIASGTGGATLGLGVLGGMTLGLP